METHNITLSFIFPDGVADDFSVSYTNPSFVAIPAHGDLVDSKIGAPTPVALKVTARTWSYDSVGNLFVFITCG